MKKLTQEQKAYINEIFIDRLQKLKEIELSNSSIYKSTLDSYLKRINQERKLIKGIKETIYNY
jgi:hypothetical protein